MTRSARWPPRMAPFWDGWRQARRHLSLLLGYALVVNVAVFAAARMWPAGPGTSDWTVSPMGVLKLVYYVLVVTPLLYATAYACLLAVRGAAPRPWAVAVRLRATYFTCVLSFVLAAGLFFMTAVPTIMLVGLLLVTLVSQEALVRLLPLALLMLYAVATAKLLFVPFAVLEQRLGAWAAVRASWRLTRGHAWNSFLLALPVWSFPMLLSSLPIVLPAPDVRLPDPLVGVLIGNTSLAAAQVLWGVSSASLLASVASDQASGIVPTRPAAAPMAT